MIHQKIWYENIKNMCKDSNNFYIQITQITVINNTNTKNSKILYKVYIKNATKIISKYYTWWFTKKIWYENIKNLCKLVIQIFLYTNNCNK